ncbi:leucine-rich repeat extensin-like protein 1, partial [Hyalella azteca]|uniref:Leucine-rich repeat extensin-like protein 1 n=1 Tax=Hyalella azteca TaxID=294128 RepID=A0A979FW98_HYAAZ
SPEYVTSPTGEYENSQSPRRASNFTPFSGLTAAPHTKAKVNVRPNHLSFSSPTPNAEMKRESKSFCTRLGNGLKGNLLAYFSLPSRPQQKKLVSSKSAPDEEAVADELTLRPFHRNSAPSYIFRPRHVKDIPLSSPPRSGPVKDIPLSSPPLSGSVKDIPLSSTSSPPSGFVKEIPLSSPPPSGAVKDILLSSPLPAGPVKDIPLSPTSPPPSGFVKDIPLSSPPPSGPVKDIPLSPTSPPPSGPVKDIPLSSPPPSGPVKDIPLSSTSPPLSGPVKDIPLSSTSSPPSGPVKGIPLSSPPPSGPVKDIPLSSTSPPPSGPVKDIPLSSASPPPSGFAMDVSPRERQLCADAIASKQSSQHWRWSFRRFEESQLDKPGSDTLESGSSDQQDDIHPPPSKVMSAPYHPTQQGLRE